MFVWLICSPALAADARTIIENGNGRDAPACASCHGGAGEGNPDGGFPRLGGLSADYILHQLASFDDGSRANDVMAPIAKALNPDERQVVAAYFAGHAPPAAAADAKPDEKLVARGKALAALGDWSKGVPGCGQCHGDAGQGVGAAFPALAAQPAAYIAGQLDAWKDKTRKNDPLGLMAGLAAKLDSDEVAAVSAYYASLPAPVANGGGKP